MFYLPLIYLFLILTTKSQIGLEKAKKTQLKVPKKWKKPQQQQQKTWQNAWTKLKIVEIFCLYQC